MTRKCTIKTQTSLSAFGKELARKQPINVSSISFWKGDLSISNNSKFASKNITKLQRLLFSVLSCLIVEFYVHLLSSKSNLCILKMEGYFTTFLRIGYIRMSLLGYHPDTVVMQLLQACRNFQKRTGSEYLLTFSSNRYVKLGCIFIDPAGEFLDFSERFTILKTVFQNW